VEKLPQTYTCRNCGRTYSSREYESNRFCINCGTYLISSSKVSEFRVKRGQRLKAKLQTSSTLPENYELRKGQTEFVQEATRALKNREVFVGSAPCGIGKSLASLLAVLPQLEENRLMICFRTRSQLHIYLKELRALSRDLCCVSFFSKQDMCPLKIKGDLSYLDFFEECRRLKENCESAAKPYCRFYMDTIKREKEAEQLALDCGKRILPPEESVGFMSKRGFCAHEALKMILPWANVFLGTYHYAFDPGIRESILKSFGPGFSRVFLIVDEAHNVPNFARELLSDQLTEGTVERALRETEAFEHDSSESVEKYLKVFIKEIFQRGHSTLKTEELRLLNPQEVSDLFLANNGVSATEVASTLKEYGEYVKKKRLESGTERFSSYNHRIGVFMESFFSNIGPKYVHLIERDRGDRIALEVRSLDGREIIDPVLREVRGTILMSGFLSPPTIYRDLMLYSSDHTRLKEFGSPFPPQNRLILVAEDVSSEFKKRNDLMLEKWKNYIETISQANQGNMAVFFTSYGLMHEVASLIKTNRRMIMEDQSTRRNEVIEKLRSSSKNILYGVMGAKLSEGMDYPGNILKCVVAVGLPLATWNAYEESLIDYLEQQFPGNGRTYAYLTPAILRLVQACGRVHRSAKDRGCIVMLDSRITQPHIKRQLPNYYQKEMTKVDSPSDCAERIRTFWNLPAQSHAR
jgi:DNA excision repair protein ERCC-2